MMVVELGMSDLGPIQYQNMSQEVFIGRDYGTGRAYSEEVAAKIDAEVKKIVDEAYKLATDIINENRDQLDLIANTLIEQETITEEEINNLVAGRPLDYVEAEVVVEEEVEENKED